MVTRVTIQEFPWKILIRVKALIFLFMPIHFKKEGYPRQLCKFNWCHSRCAFMFLGRRVFFVWIKFLFQMGRAPPASEEKTYTTKGFREIPELPNKRILQGPLTKHMRSLVSNLGGNPVKTTKIKFNWQTNSVQNNSWRLPTSNSTFGIIASTHSLETPAKHTLFSCNCLDITTAHLKASASATSGSVFRNNLLLPFQRPYSLKINPHDK